MMKKGKKSGMAGMMKDDKGATFVKKRGMKGMPGMKGLPSMKGMKGTKKGKTI